MGSRRNLRTILSWRKPSRFRYTCRSEACSNIKKDSLAETLENNVPFQSASPSINLFCDKRFTPSDFHEVEREILRVAGLIREIDPSNQPSQQPACENRNREVRRLQFSIRTRNAPRLNRSKAETPCEFACQISTIPSGTGLPSPSRIRPAISTRSPEMPGPAKLSR